MLRAEAVVWRCSVEKVLLKILQNSQECTCVTLLKKTLCHSCFPVNFAKFLRTPFFTEQFRWLLLHFLVTRNNLHYYLETMLMLSRLMMMSCFVVYQLTNEVTVNLFLTGTTIGNSCHHKSQHIVSYV